MIRHRVRRHIGNGAPLRGDDGTPTELAGPDDDDTAVERVPGPQSVNDFGNGGIALPNAPSVALHERLGFRKVAHFEQVGHKLGRWVDVGYWQLLLQPTASSDALATADSGTD